MKVIETEVLIIGGGVTGAGIMRDLSLRGIQCLLIDRQDLCAGASGGNHGLLHSGARYVSNDLHAARECRIESDLLKRLAPQCIEKTGGLFVSTAQDDPGFADQFPGWCEAAGITCDEVSSEEARKMEPRLTNELGRVYFLPDSAVDPFRLALENVADAERMGKSIYRAHTQLIGFNINQGRIESAVCRGTRSGTMYEIKATQYVNAGGAWAMGISRMAGCTTVNLLFSKGTLLISYDRLTEHVVHRLRVPSDGDIIVPGGTVSVLGTTSVRVDDPDKVIPTVKEVDLNIQECSAMVPDVIGARFIRAFSRIRPLLLPGDDSDDRAVTRGFALIDHEKDLENFITITGGKLTTYRLMAEKTADLVAGRLGNTEACRTASEPMQSESGCRWTEPGAAPKYWFSQGSKDDMILCECEMVPRSAIDEIIESAPGAEEEMTLEAIALRSRAGKGPCQGAFCSLRITTYLYDLGYYRDSTGLLHMRDFLNERFKGMRAVTWGHQSAQMELAEAFHCGLLGLDQLVEKKELPAGKNKRMKRK